MRAGERGAEAGEVGAAFGRVDVVDVGVDVFGVLGRVLQGDFDGDAFAVAFDVEDIGVDRLAGAVEVLDVLAEAVVVLVRFFFAGAVVGDGDADALVQEGQLLHALLERGEDELRVREDLRVGFERGFGAAFGGVADAADVGLGDAAFVLLVVDLAVAADFDFAPFGEEVDDGDADAVEAAGGLVGAFFEFAAEFEDGHHAFERGDVAADFFGELGVALDGDAAAVVFDRDRAVDVDRDADRGGVAGHRFVDRVVDDFVDEVVQAAGRGVADVHRRAFADVLQVAEVLEVLGGVAIAAAGRSSCFRIDRFRVLQPSCSITPAFSDSLWIHHRGTEGTERKKSPMTKFQ